MSPEMQALLTSEYVGDNGILANSAQGQRDLVSMTRGTAARPVALA